MKFLQLLLLVTLTAGFVIPDEKVLAGLVKRHCKAKGWLERLSGKEQVGSVFENTFRHADEVSDKALDETFAYIDDKTRLVREDLEGSKHAITSRLEQDVEPDGEGFEEFDGLRHHDSDSPRPHKTIYELISSLNPTTKLAKLIEEDNDLVALLNSTKGNYTLFAPSDTAFRKIPKYYWDPSKDTKRVLLHHITPGSYTAGQVLLSKTVPTLLKEASLGDQPQRISARLRLSGIFLDSYSRIEIVNIGASNGIIHIIDEILVPPSPTLKILSTMPTQFSTFMLGLSKTGILKMLEETSHAGGTFFAPSNLAFQRLGPEVNEFLFGDRGEEYLAALLKYHIVANETLYQTAFYNGTSKTGQDLESNEFLPSHYLTEASEHEAFVARHLDLPTLLDGKTIGVDINQNGPFVSMRVRSVERVVGPDIVAKDGVIHALGNILLPLKPDVVATPGVVADGKEEAGYSVGQDISQEEFKARLEVLVENWDGSDSDSESDSEEKGEFRVMPFDEWKDL